MISRHLISDRIRYILGAPQECRRRVYCVPSKCLSCINYVFFDNNETLRAWLLSNPVHDNALDLMIYCQQDKGDDPPVTPSLRPYQYFRYDILSDWTDATAGYIRYLHYQTLYIPLRFNYGGFNGSRGYENRGPPDLSLIEASNLLSDHADTRDRGQDSTWTPPPVGNPVLSPIAHALLAVKSSNQLNAPMSPD